AAHAPGPARVAFDPAPGREGLLSAGADRVVRRWDVTTGEEKASWQAPFAGSAVWAGPDGKALVAGGAGRGPRLGPALKLGDTTQEQTLGEPRREGEAHAVARSPDGRTFAVATGYPTGRDPHITVRAWDVSGQNEKELCSVAGQGFYWAAGGKTLITLDADGT